MLQPKKRKHRKEFRGKMRGLAWKGSTVTYGEYGLQTLDRGWITSNEIEAARRTITRHTKRKGKIWIKIFPHKPVTGKSAEVKRGGGKGEVQSYVAVIKPGRVLIEVGGIPQDLAAEALRLASHKFSCKTRMISKSKI